MKPRDYIEGVLFFAAILATGVTIIGRCSPAPEVAPRQTITDQVLDYPYKDDSAVIKAAEAKVVKRIDKVERTYCEDHLDTYPCGIWLRRNGKWEKGR